MQWALMGADEFGFGTVAMIATGCVMARICHTNNCPVGVATQREELRARFPGAPSDLVNFFIFAAEEVRVILAEMGYKSLDEVIGRNDLLKQKEQKDPKTNHLDLSLLTTSSGKSDSSKARINQKVHDDGELLDDILLANAGVKRCIENQGTHTISSKIVNEDRAAMARIAGNIAAKYGDDGFKGKLTIKLEGAGGQSFGAFVVGGMDVQLVGEANDYVCKSISGGTSRLCRRGMLDSRLKIPPLLVTPACMALRVVRSSLMVELANDLPLEIPWGKLSSKDAAITL